jgi:hypothetical protein
MSGLCVVSILRVLTVISTVAGDSLCSKRFFLDQKDPETQGPNPVELTHLSFGPRWILLLW